MPVFKNPRRVKRKTIRIIRIVFAIVVVLVAIFPVYQMFVIALEGKLIYGYKSTIIGLEDWHLWPRYPTLNNFLALTQGQWGVGIRNSVIISISNTVLCTLVAIPAAYALTRVSFRFKRWFFFWVMLNRVAPPGLFIMPFYIIYTSIGLYDTIPGVVIIHTVFNLPLAIWMLSGFMRDIPTTLDEQAFIDGWSVFGFLRRVFIPLLMPAIGVTAFFLWMFSWTEMLLASAVTFYDAYPLTVNLLIFGGGQATAAGAFSMIPGIIILLIMRRSIARGFMLGSRV